jgi:UrcA family protein
VALADLDLGSADGAGTFYHCIQGAARVVCGYADRSVATLAQLRSCSDGAISDAVTSGGAPLLSAIHNAHRGATVTAVFND